MIFFKSIIKISLLVSPIYKSDRHFHASVKLLITEQDSEEERERRQRLLEKGQEVRSELLDMEEVAREELDDCRDLEGDKNEIASAKFHADFFYRAAVNHRDSGLQHQKTSEALKSVEREVEPLLRRNRIEPDSEVANSCRQFVHKTIAEAKPSAGQARLS